MSKLRVKVLSPLAELASIEAQEVSVPALYGYMGLRPSHTPIIAEIGLGALEIIDNNEALARYFVSGGYFELIDDELTILVDTIEAYDAIDRGRADQAAERALERLNQTSDLNVDISRALASLERAKARRKLANMHK